MKFYKEEEFDRGWFVGNFEPSCLKTDEAEVSIKRYSAGDEEPSHHHKVATEITLIVEGEVSINDVSLKKGDIVVVEPFESVKFKALKDSVNLVVKIPSVKGDKYED
jgi:helix-turn-helix protein